MNSRQKVFCEQYIIHLNATRAAIEAGYSDKTAHAIASRLMNDPKIEEYIEALKLEREEKVKFTSQEVLERLAILSRASIAKFFKRSNCGTAVL